MSLIPPTTVPDPEPQEPEETAVGIAAREYGRRIQLSKRVYDELLAQDAKWGEQNHPDGTGPHQPVLDAVSEHVSFAFPDEVHALALADASKEANAGLVATGDLTWRDVLTEEVFEAYAESDPERLIEELVQVAAVALQWAQAVQRRTA